MIHLSSMHDIVVERSMRLAHQQLAFEQAVLSGRQVQRGLGLLLQASSYADELSSSRWDFAVEIHQLLNSGLTINDLRVMVRLRYLEHAQELSRCGKQQRRFLLTGELTFTQGTCFILTPKGFSEALQIMRTPLGTCCVTCSPMRIAAETRPASKSIVPIWNAERRTLSFEGEIVKHFKRRAQNQVLVVATFQEENWPARILDPLTPSPSLVAKRRLAETIKSLNQGQVALRIRFRGDGTGEGVVWEAVR